MDESSKEIRLRRYEGALHKLADNNDGHLTAEIVVQEARKVKSPLHDWFEWDDDKAATEFRLEQARRLIRTCYVVVRDDAAPERTVHVRSFEHVDGAYRRIDDIMRSDKWKTELLNRLAKEINAMRQRYQAIASLQNVYDPIDEKLAEAEQLAKSGRGAA